ncbi:MAG: hypothetical protein ACRAVC_09100 [Trichormus sp.]
MEEHALRRFPDSLSGVRRYAEAIQLLTPAINHRSDRTQAIIHSNLSLAYQQLGNCNVSSG